MSDAVVTLDERAELQRVYLETGSYKKTAERCHRDPVTVSRQCHGPDFDARLEVYKAELGRRAVGILSRAQPGSAAHWARVAKGELPKGRHGAAKELLEAMGAVVSQQKPSIQVTIGVAVGVRGDEAALPVTACSNNT